MTKCMIGKNCNDFGNKYWRSFSLFFLILITGSGILYYYFPWIIANQQISGQPQTFEWELSKCEGLFGSSRTNVNFSVVGFPVKTIIPDAALVVFV